MSKMSIETEPVRRSLNGETMGTRYSAVFYAVEALDLASLSSALFEAVDRVDRQMSTWKPDSDLNRLNAAPVGSWVTLAQELTSVLAAARRIGQHSGGAFDISVGERVAAWGFGANAAKTMPSKADMVEEHATGCTFEIDLSRRRARRLQPVSLDLSGIAKGFGVDELGRVMMRFGIRSWLVGIDGEMRGKGCKLDGSPWIIAHERPVPGIREAMGTIELTDLAVATSGTYRHFRKVGDATISHTIDPRSGLPVASAVASVTVLAQTCMEADAWATAFMVTGPEKGLPLARVMGMDAMFVLADGTVRSSL